jgi:molybdate transport system substrate-binding protein
MRRRAAAAAALAALAVAMGGLAACGGGEEAGSTKGDEPIVVSAASSLTTAFTAYADVFDGPAVRFSFAGSDALAAQIRQGVRPDVFAGANTELPRTLHAEGLVEKPVVFATNRLVLAVPLRSDKVTSLADLAEPGMTIAIGSESVPIGAYTREVLDRLGPARAQAILANVRSEEPDVNGIAGKLAQGAVDAAFLYATDIETARGLRGILLPARLRPRVAYAAAVVAGAPHPAAAGRFVAGPLHGAGATALSEASFGAAPR